MELKNFFAQDEQGNALANASCYLYERGTESLVSDLLKANGEPLSNPFAADQAGLIQFSAPNGLYDLRVAKLNRDYRIQVQLTDLADSISEANAGADRASNEADRAEMAVGEADRFLQTGLGAIVRPLREKMRDTVGIKDFGAICDNASHPLRERYSTLATAQKDYPHAYALDNEIDWCAAQAALLTGGSPNLAGTCMVQAPLAVFYPGQLVNGKGAFQDIIRATPKFVGDSVLIFGAVGSSTIVRAMGASGFAIDCNAVEGTSGLALYGLRDGSSFNSVYVTNNKNAPGIKTNMAGNGSGIAGGRMCQGVQFWNCQVITDQDMVGVPYWKLDGIFESRLTGCKALGSSKGLVSGSTGFLIGNVSEVRALILSGCSTGNFVGGGNNIGIHYSKWARECWDEFTTFENILGCGVYFHGSGVSGTLLPFDCRSLHPRPYNSAEAGILDPLYRVGDSNGCFAGVINYYNSNKVWVRFDAPVEAQFNNIVDIVAGMVPSALLSTIISFDINASPSNMVVGFSSDASASRKEIVFNKGGHTERHEANGFSEQHDGGWDTVNLGTPNKIRIRDALLSTVFSIDGGVLVPERTSMSLMSNKGGVMTFDRVQVGPANSAGTGYRQLRIPN